MIVKFENAIVTVKVDLERLKTHGLRFLSGTGSKVNLPLCDGQTSFEIYKILFEAADNW